MQPEELEKFNIEMKALLIKYDVNLTISNSIEVNKNPPMSEVTGTKEVDTLSEVAKSE